ncbi:chromate transporter [Methylibium rhizosphaerae]|jgi:chromate transporter|uniref:chromate transporter n=1 Tax=Methylibium rhizosphaerae TaxID=2570323 RepID=UPI00112D28CB|nr:chromate transporter [Methylibium rhizosphaerae]
MSTEIPAPGPEAMERPASCTDLFLTFTTLALQGFGGVLPVVQRELCERRRWLTKEQFLETLALGQVLPGPNVCNVSLMVGDRFFGTRGAFAALAGMMSVPLVLVLALTALYAQFAANEVVAGALRGMGAVAAGLIVGTAFKLAATLRRNAMGLAACLLLGAATFGMVALLHWPLVWVLLALGPLACGYAAWRLHREERKPA